jgi:hypothetical protein
MLQAVCCAGIFQPVTAIHRQSVMLPFAQGSLFPLFEAFSALHFPVGPTTLLVEQ